MRYISPTWFRQFACCVICILLLLVVIQCHNLHHRCAELAELQAYRDQLQQELVMGEEVTG